MSKTIRDQGGVLCRIIEAINGFRSKFGHWPTVLVADSGTVALLATVHLTPLGFFLLQSKLDIETGQDLEILAKGAGGEVFDTAPMS